MTNRLLWADKRLQYQFSDSKLLDLALTHRSAAKHNNERLEFLGDAFLNFSIAQELYEIRPDDSEGDLSRLRASLVKGTTLAELGRELEIAPLIVMGAGELRSGGSNRDSTIANAVEAVIGAVLLDGGAKAADSCVTRLFESRLKNLPSADSLKDAKTKLQEWLQGRGLGLPIYEVESVTGEPHQQCFVVSCELRDSGQRTTGHGQSRRHAEQDAAERMHSELNSDGKK
ncbi:MAG: ribonuclease III [Gammaproteobacteria bacterium]